MAKLLLQTANAEADRPGNAQIIHQQRSHFIYFGTTITSLLPRTKETGSNYYFKIAEQERQ